MSRWDEAYARYASARAAERAHDAEHIDAKIDHLAFKSPEWRAAFEAIPTHVWAESERLADIRDQAEDVLFGMDAPDLAGFARKFLICRADGRDLNGLDEHLVAEARRLIAQVAV